MIINKLSEKKVYTAFFLTLSVLIGTGLLKPFIASGITTLYQLIGGLIPSITFLSFYLTKGKQKVIPATIITAVILSWLSLTGLEETLGLFRDYFYSWFSNNITDEGTAIFQIINISLTGAILIPFIRIIERSFKLRITTAAGLAIYLLAGLIFGFGDDKFHVCLSILFIVFIISEFLQKAKNAEKIVIYLLPFFFIYLFVLLLIPASDEPYGWAFARNFYNNIRQAAVRINDLFDGGNDGFGMEVTGFSGAGEVRSQRIFARSRDAMYVTLTRGKRMNVYLTGNVFDTFDGDAWIASIAETQYDQKLDLLETLYAVYRYDSENFDDYLNQAELRLSYNNLRTEFLFAPLKTHLIELPWNVNIYERGGQLNFSERRGHGTNYQLSFFQMNLGQEFFREMIAAESGYPYNFVMPAEFIGFYYLKYSGGLPLYLFNEENLLRRSESIYTDYLKPYPLSNAVLDLLAEITKDAANIYEMCLALEQTLAGRADIAYTYTTNPEALPAGEVFPDYFLFNSRAGYCTYFATAFVLLARELGIPARYVQGYLVTDERLGLETVTVLDGMAHAWPEVYFRGVGWIPFEPTPGFTLRRHRFWNPAGMADAARLSIIETEEIPDYEQDEPEPSAVFDEPGESRLLDVFLIVISTLIFGAFVIIIIDKQIKRRQYKRFSLNQRFIAQVRLNLLILAMIGFKLMPGESIAEFADRIKKSGKLISIKFVTPLEQMLYRGDDVSETIIEDTVSERNELYKLIKKANKLKYYRIRFRILLTVHNSN